MLIYFHKRDFRLFDNDALHLAASLCLKENIPLLPIMGLETDLIENLDTAYEFSEFQQYGALSAILPLFRNYTHFGISPLLFKQSSLELLEEIQKKQKIRYIISHEEPGTFGTYARDKKIKKFCLENNIFCIEIPHNGIVRRLVSRDMRNHHMSDYLSAPTLPIPELRNVKSFDFKKDFDIGANLTSLQKIKDEIGLKYKLEECSEKYGIEVLNSFIAARASRYRGGISSPNSAIIHGSRLSQFLAYGSLSLRHVHHSFSRGGRLSEDRKIKAGLLGAMTRLHWRSHFVQRIEDDCRMSARAINSEFDGISYLHNEELFERYKKGQTGEVLIDACIRCLHTTGFINFRMRALLVSYAVFGLDLDWRTVGQFLATLFLDYEPGIHWSQMQMQAQGSLVLTQLGCTVRINNCSIKTHPVSLSKNGYRN